MTNYNPLPTLPSGEITVGLLNNYLKALVNRFFKILPLWEEQIDTVGLYMQGLRAELLGCKSLLPIINEDALFLSLVSILQFLIDNPDCDTREVKREVFAAIDICNKLIRFYVQVPSEDCQGVCHEHMECL